MSPHAPSATPPRDSLDDLLTGWQVELGAAPDFQREVWRRISARQDDLTWSERALFWWLVPRRMILTAVAAIVLGSSLGAWTGTLHNAQARAAYFNAIDPLNHQHTHTLASR